VYYVMAFLPDTEDVYYVKPFLPDAKDWDSAKAFLPGPECTEFNPVLNIQQLNIFLFI
jgi:hypothetical protein